MCSIMPRRSDKISRVGLQHRLQGMNTRHAVIESPLGELTLVAEDGALTGSYQATWPGSPQRNARFTAAWRESGKKCG